MSVTARDVAKAFSGLSLDQIQAALAKLPEDQRAEIEATADAAVADKRWLPNPGPQTAAYLSEADELFYGGAAGGGKSALLCGVGINEHQRVRILRRQAAQVGGLVEEVQSILGSSAGLTRSPQMVWRVPDGPIIDFNGCQHEDDKTNFQGRARDLIGFDEITEFTRSQYRFIIGWNRPAPGVPTTQRCRAIATGNPPVDDDGMWVIEHWGPWLDPNHPNPALPGELRYFTTIDGKDFECEGPDPVEVPDERAEGGVKLIYPRSRTFIPASLEDNPDLMKTNYASVLEAMPEELRIRLRDGAFSAVIGDDEFQVIPRAWVEAACARWTPEPPEGVAMTSLGVDVARGGRDEMTLAPRYGRWFGPIERVEGKDVPDGQTALGHIARVRRDSAQVNIDGIGVGASPVDFLKENEIPTLILNAAAGSTAKAKVTGFGFANLRAEMWWRMRERLDPANPDKIALPPDPKLKADLCALRYRLRSNGYIMEPKEDVIGRIGRSPDSGDAVVMAAYAGDARARRRGGKAPAKVRRGFDEIKARQRRYRR